MTKRIINKDLLRLHIKEIGLELVAVKAGCSASLLQKLVSDSYDRVPSLRTIDGLCFATNEELNRLFPVFDDLKESA